MKSLSGGQIVCLAQWDYFFDRLSDMDGLFSGFCVGLVLKDGGLQGFLGIYSLFFMSPLVSCWSMDVV